MQRELRGEVVVQHGGADPAAAADLVDRRAVIAALGEDAGRFRLDLVRAAPSALILFLDKPNAP